MVQSDFQPTFAAIPNPPNDDLSICLGSYHSTGRSLDAGIENREDPGLLTKSPRSTATVSSKPPTGLRNGNHRIRLESPTQWHVPSLAASAEETRRSKRQSPHGAYCPLSMILSHSGTAAERQCRIQLLVHFQYRSTHPCLQSPARR